MRTFSRTSQFKRDLKRAEKRGCRLEKLREVLDLLISGDELPARFRDHPLPGKFRGSRKCQLSPDWILFYTIDKNHLRLERTGTPSDLS